MRPNSSTWLAKQTNVFPRTWVCFTVLADPGANVFYNRECLVGNGSRFSKSIGVRPEAAQYQTAFVSLKPER